MTLEFSMWDHMMIHKHRRTHHCMTLTHQKVPTRQQLNVHWNAGIETWNDYAFHTKINCRESGLAWFSTVYDNIIQRPSLLQIVLNLANCIGHFSSAQGLTIKVVKT